MHVGVKDGKTAFKHQMVELSQTRFLQYLVMALLDLRPHFPQMFPIIVKTTQLLFTEYTSLVSETYLLVFICTLHLEGLRIHTPPVNCRDMDNRLPFRSLYILVLYGSF